MSVEDSVGALSALLSEITVLLQLDQTRFERAQQAYRGVGHYLEANAPAGVQLDIYPQGSMRLQATVKPLARSEYDLDIVAELYGLTRVHPQHLYDWGLRLLSDHGTYGKLVEPLNRCVRLNYAGDFHLDVLFALHDTDPSTSPSSILVPDRRRQDYTWSDPRGYADWFEWQCAVDRLREKRMVALRHDPLPSNDPAELKAVLKRVVQLIKRARDMWFRGDDAAPRSVVLSTLAADVYLGSTKLYEALLSVMERITSSIEAAHARGEQLVVRNPTNWKEEFSEAWRAKPEDYEKAVKWIFSFRDQLRALRTLRGHRLSDELKALFGEEVVGRAQVELAERVRRARQQGGLRRTGSGLAILTDVGTNVPDHTFYGDEYGEEG